MKRVNQRREKRVAEGGPMFSDDDEMEEEEPPVGEDFE
jgi:hypothetical protein